MASLRSSLILPRLSHQIPRSLAPAILVPSRGHATALDPLPTPAPSPSQQSSLQASSRSGPFKKWERKEVQEIYDGPLMDLAFKAASVHRQFHDPSKIQLCTLLNIKTGGCSEDCSYCSQSSRHKTGLKAEKLAQLEPVLAEARLARSRGSTRFCMGAAWRDLHGRKSGFERILKMVEGVRELGMEVCATLGMLTPEQAKRLKEAGLTAYNHNLDTSREFYPKVITTRSFDDRLSTIAAVQEAGISVCSGGILGLGEEEEDRVGLIWEMSRLQNGRGPESFPVNALVAIKGTPLEGNDPVKLHDMIRTIATARIVMPHSIIRFAAGRINFSEAEQAMCFMAGANAIFTGERMLTTPCSGYDEDQALLDRWGLKGMDSFESEQVREREEMEPKRQTREANVGVGEVGMKEAVTI